MYTPEETQYLLENYENNVPELAIKLGRSERSIIGKLSKMGIYQKKEYVSKTGEKPITKLELVKLIADNRGIKLEKLEGLDKAPKAVLKELARWADDI